MQQIKKEPNLSQPKVNVFGLIVLLAAILSGCALAPAATAHPTSQASSASATTAPVETPANTTYSWHGSTLTLSAALPAGPAEAGVFVAQPVMPASIESARALAAQLEMSGEIYEGPSGVPGASGFLVVDGNRRLMVRAEGDFNYYTGLSNYWTSTDSAHPADAEEQIADFMSTYGFGEEYSLHYSEIHGSYFALPLLPGDLPLRHNHFTPSGYHFSFNESGISSVAANLISYDPTGTFGLISSEEALQKLIDPDLQVGKLEGFVSPTGIYSAWVRSYPQDQTVTIFGYMSSTPSLEGSEPLVTLDGYTATGNLAGIAATMSETFVEASGQFHAEGGVDVFVLESWSVYNGYNEGLMGTLEARGDNVVLVTEQGELLMPDVPADVPLPLESVYAMGVTRGDVFEWNAFDLRMASGGGGGGGGGGGLGLYKLNLSGTPVPVPTEDVSEDLQPGQRVEAQRGVVIVTFYNQPDGSQRVEYTLYTSEGNPYAMILEGEGLEGLQAMHNRPVDVWGTISANDKHFGLATLDTERFEIPFPDLQFQILRGTQQEILINDQPGVLFTTSDGQAYVQVIPGGTLDTSLIGVPGDEVLLEGLIIPGETISGYETVRIFSGSLAMDSNGEAIDMQITADQPWVTDEPIPDPDNVEPTADIETVELVYFMQDPRLNAVAEAGAVEYIQPMWRFAGHYSSGEVFEILVQALQAEFLLPEIQTIVGPG